MEKTKKESQILELLDELLFASKMVYRGEATKEELQPEVDERKRKLYKLGWGKQGSLTYLGNLGWPVVFSKPFDWKLWDGWLLDV